MANNEKDFEMQPNTEAIEHLDKPQVQASRHDQDIDEKYTHKEQRKIIHKVDRRLLIVLGLMQAVSFLDRTNISNANIAG